jgi:YggT family protein
LPVELVRIVNFLLTLLSIVILARVILSWVIPLTGGRPHPLLVSVITVINQITEPILAPLRRVIPSIGTLDLSPMVALIIIAIISTLILPRLQ